MAEEAGLEGIEQAGILEHFNRFAALVAAHERKDCAKVCEESDTWVLYDPNGFAANLIRARGEK